MKRPDDDLIRRYILSTVTEAERFEVEEWMIVDRDFYDEVMAAEQDLVDDYAAGELIDPERTHFEENFLSTDHGRAELALARALKERSVRDETNTNPAPIP